MLLQKIGFVPFFSIKNYIKTTKKKKKAIKKEYFSLKTGLVPKTFNTNLVHHIMLQKKIISGKKLEPKKLVSTKTEWQIDVVTNQTFI